MNRLSNFKCFLILSATGHATRSCVARSHNIWRLNISNGHQVI